MIKLSIVIPVYNVEKFLERCLRSVAEQDLDHKMFEIIVINDGTKDNSLSIATQVAQDYNNIKIVSQENTGLGGARNLGIFLAKGEYIWFIDSDDFITKNSLKGLIDNLINIDLDILAFDYSCTNEKGELIDWINFKLNFNNQKILSGPEFYALNYKHSYIWLYLFKRSLFVDNNIVFKTRINMQDSELLPRILFHAKTIAFYDFKIYYYVNRQDSFINSKKISTRVKYYSSIISVYKHLKDFKNVLDEKHLISKTLNKKQVDIHKMLFLQFIYTEFDSYNLKLILKELKKHKLFPFKSFYENDILKKCLYVFLKAIINIMPISGRKFYLRIRNKPFLKT